MYDMKPLEEEWLKYQTKKRKPLYLFFILLAVFLLLIFLFINKNNVKFNFFEKYLMSSDKTSTITSGLSLQNNNQNVLLNKALKRLEVFEVESKITPIEVNSNSNMHNITSDILVDIPILDKEGENIIDKSDINRRKKVYLNIIETTSISAYEDVEKRFHQSHDIDDAIFLAKTYYKKGHYKKAEQWAFEANKIDDELEESFLIFVKAKMKLGKKNEAKAILNQYLKQNNSKDAKVLLNQIENNKF